jgi:hypothetical protein
MKHMLIGLVVVLFFGLWVTPGLAVDPCESEVVRTWVVERDAAVVRLLRQWLREAPQEALRQEVLALTRYEIFLANCAPPFDVDDFYLLHLSRVDVHSLPGAVLLRYLKKHGIDLTPAHFFAGRRFSMLAPRQ